MGSMLTLQGDRQYYADAAAFLSASGETAAMTAPVAGWFWWSFNANSNSEFASLFDPVHTYRQV
jgi:hypothetical protein